MPFSLTARTLAGCAYIAEHQEPQESISVRRIRKLITVKRLCGEGVEHSEPAAGHIRDCPDARPDCKKVH